MCWGSADGALPTCAGTVPSCDATAGLKSNTAHAATTPKNHLTPTTDRPIFALHTSCLPFNTEASKDVLFLKQRLTPLSPRAANERGAFDQARRAGDFPLPHELPDRFQRRPEFETHILLLSTSFTTTNVTNYTMSSSLASHGRGGAGNMADAKQSPQLKPSDLETPTLKKPIVTTGRGGTGNMARNKDPVETRMRQDVEA